MSANKRTTGMQDKKVILSTLWIFALFNYLYADVFSLFFNPEAEGLQFTPELVLGFAALMETAIAMVLLSRVLGHRANRWANIFAGALHTAAVAWSLTAGTSSAYYVFFATVEIACTLFIIGYAWTWRNPEE